MQLLWKVAKEKEPGSVGGSAEAELVLLCLMGNR
jgi:hypothetical protein